MREQGADAIKPAETPARRYACFLGSRFRDTCSHRVSPLMDNIYNISQSLLGFTPRFLRWRLIIHRASPPSFVATDFMNRILLPQHLSDKRSALSPPARLPFALFSCGFRFTMFTLDCLFS